MSDAFGTGLGFFLIVVVPLVSTGVILRKCGMSLWWLGLAPLPIVLLPVVALRHWPIRDDVSRLRLICGEGSQADVDIVMRTAIKAEANGDWPRAKSLFELIAQYPQSDSETVSYVRGRLNLPVEATADVSNPYRSPVS
jgi:hypothetical protein